jgi:hypothetical protein
MFIRARLHALIRSASALDKRWTHLGAAAAVVLATVASPVAQQIIPGRNVNMVAGTKWPDGDPYLQRQNEPSIAASTRNPLHLLAGANDYRTVDIPFVNDANETGDAWLGLFKSIDGGQRWKSTLLPGYPQDVSPEGTASPLKGYTAAADPIVRAGTNGLFYYTGLVFDRAADGNGRSAIFAARFIDNNNREAGDPVRYLGASMIVKSAGGAGGVFLDKPWMVVDIPRDANTCAVTTTEFDPLTHQSRQVTQNVPAGPVYVAYTAFTQDAAGQRSDIYFTMSPNCGVTWTSPVRVNNLADRVNQGATMAVNPPTGDVYIAWRRFANPTDTTSTDGIVVARYNRTSRAIQPPGLVRKLPTERFADILDKIDEKRKAKTAPTSTADDDIESFDQGTTDISGSISFRTNVYPTVAVDPSGRVYLAWSERGYGTARPSPIDGDARIVMATSTDGVTWSTPRAIANETTVNGQPIPGHQFMPTLAIGGGQLVLVYYDLRDDVSQTFTAFADDRTAIAARNRRRTLDLRASIGTLGATPAFAASERVSDYLTKEVVTPGGIVEQQMQYNAPNLPMFKSGTSPFIGDYVDIATAPAFVATSSGKWAYNTNGEVLFHAVWTDNRDVRQPGFDANGDGNPWNDYTAPTERAGTSASIFDPTKTLPPCTAVNTGSRNQNIYTARLSTGLIVGSPSNTKPLSTSLVRSFSVFAQNTTSFTKTFRMAIDSQPLNGRASFNEFSAQPLVSIDVTTPPRSLAARTVYATSTDPHAQVTVHVTEITAVGGIPVPNGLSDAILLNPDISNPDISNPDISNPDISNPDISNAEVFNPDISNPDISNPDISNPDISNPDISNPDISNPDISNPDISNPDISNVVVANPDISNPDISNPDISNPDISNPDISNPDISNPDISNTALTDVTWTVTNNGNTASSFNVNLFLAQATSKICADGQSPTDNGCIATQLLLTKSYSTPTTTGCEIQVQTQNILVSNIANPHFVTPGTSAAASNDPSATNATMWLGPGETARITLRLADPDTSDNASIGGASIDPLFVPSTSGQGGGLTPFVVAQPISTPDLVNNGGGGGGMVTLHPASVFFVQQPTSGTTTTAIAPPVRVQVRDQQGAALPNATVTLTLLNPPGVLASLTGGSAVQTDASGIATFPALFVDLPGTGFQLQATVTDSISSSSISNHSVPFDIVLGQTGPWFLEYPQGSTFTILDGGATGHPAMQYSQTTPGVFTGAWTFSTTADTAGQINLQYFWKGFHSFFEATAGLDVFVQRNGVDVSVVNLINAGPTDCPPCTPPSAGFNYTGTTSVNVQAGDVYGFRLRGSHFDIANTLQGTFVVSIGGTPAVGSVSPSAIAAGTGFLAVRGVGLPLANAIVSNGNTTANGFILPSASTSSTAFVRVPGGFPAGPAFVRLQDAGATLTTNAMPVTITTVPPPPIITNAYNTNEVAITGVTAGQEIVIAADGIDTVGATLTFVQGTTTWSDVHPSLVRTNTNVGVAVQVTVPAITPGGPAVQISISQSGGPISNPIVLIAQ